MRRVLACTATLVLSSIGVAGAHAAVEPAASVAQSAAASEPPRAGSAKAKRARTVTLRHRASGFRIKTPRGFRLQVRKGVYVMRKGSQALSFSRSVTSVTPAEFGAALLAQIGGTVISQRPGASFSAQVDRGPRRETIVIVRAGNALMVTTGSAPGKRSLSVGAVRRVSGSARGGFALTPPAPQPPSPMPLTPYRAPDGGASLLVPAEPGWNVSSAQGTVQGSSDAGAFLFGFSINIFLPQTAPPGTPASILVSPYLNAQDALAQIFPRISPAVSDVRIRSVLVDAVLPTFSSSAMYLYDYKVNGRPWTGAATIATDSPDRYSNFVWNLYFSGIGVPQNADPRIGIGLLRAWQSWDPSGAIAARTRQAKEIMNETNEIWRQTNEFRFRIADQQSRDVGCLLSGYYAIEDNARQYQLPPLPCGQVYVKN